LRPFLTALAALVLALVPLAQAGLDDPTGLDLFCVEASADAQCSGVAVSATGNASGRWWGASQVSGDCALFPNGTARCSDPLTDVPEETYTGGDAVGVGEARQHGCVVTSGGDLHCWGSFGYNGAPDLADYLGGDAAQVSVGAYNACALLRSGDVQCWGDRSFGESDGYAGGDARAVAAGAWDACALLASGDVSCWGIDGFSYAGHDAVEVAVWMGDMCVVTTGADVRCFGSDDYGQAAGYLGGDATHVSLAQRHACATTRAGDVRCWGQRDPSDADYAGGDATQVTTSDARTCALLDNGVEHCWPSSQTSSDDRGRALLAVSGTRDAVASDDAASLTGDASGCRAYDEASDCGAVSLTGRAEGDTAIAACGELGTCMA
jgi:hypothetical protein